MTDCSLMQQAIAEATAAAAMEEVPVGCVVLHRPSLRIIGRGHNRRNADADPTAHAEMLRCGRRRRPGHWRLMDCTLAVTLEPCPMCAVNHQSPFSLGRG